MNPTDRAALARAFVLFLATAVSLLGWDETLRFLEKAGEIARTYR